MQVRIAFFKERQRSLRRFLPSGGHLCNAFGQPCLKLIVTTTCPTNLQYNILSIVSISEQLQTHGFSRCTVLSSKKSVPPPPPQKKKKKERKPFSKQKT